MKTSQQIRRAIAASLALGLAACGGGGGHSSDAVTAPAAADPATQSVPPSAVNSTASFLDYQMSLQGQVSDTIEPLTLQQMLPPLDDTAEPTSLS